MPFFAFQAGQEESKVTEKEIELVLALQQKIAQVCIERLIRRLLTLVLSASN